MTFEQALMEYIPEHMRGAVLRYTQEGLLPGSFLTAVIENDLKGAVGYADHINMERLPQYVRFFYNWAPSTCWGSPERVRDWVKAHSPKTQVAEGKGTE